MPINNSRPSPRREVAIESVKLNTITLWATEDAAVDFVEFGVLSREEDSSRYRLYVDMRYGLKDVVDYIETYDKQYRDLPDWG